MKLPRWILACGCLVFAGCSDDEASNGSGEQTEGALDRSKRIRELENALDRLKWENSVQFAVRRLFLYFDSQKSLY